MKLSETAHKEYESKCNQKILKGKTAELFQTTFSNKFKFIIFENFPLFVNVVPGIQILENIFLIFN